MNEMNIRARKAIAEHDGEGEGEGRGKLVGEGGLPKKEVTEAPFSSEEVPPPESFPVVSPGTVGGDVKLTTDGGEKADSCVGRVEGELVRCERVGSFVGDVVSREGTLDGGKVEK